jgi:hypothetical protein
MSFQDIDLSHRDRFKEFSWKASDSIKGYPLFLS